MKVCVLESERERMNEMDREQKREGEKGVYIDREKETFVCRFV